MDICSNNGSCGNSWPSIQLKQATQSSISVCLKDKSGSALALDPLVHSVSFIVKEWPTDSNNYFTKDCTISLSTVGVVSFIVEPNNVPYAGIWLGEFEVKQLVDDSSAPDPLFEEVVIDRLPCYVEVQLSIKASANKTHRPLTIFEVRMAMRDRCSADNSFLESLEFTDAEVAYAMQRPIDYWNEALPPMDHYTYTYATFPYKYQWTDATVGELLRMAGNNLMRNNMKITAGGISHDDSSKASAYLSLGSQLVAEYKNWVAGRKYSLNMSDCYGSTNIPDFG
jgi:hypothetical protein